LSRRIKEAQQVFGTRIGEYVSGRLGAHYGNAAAVPQAISRLNA
jgi:hypothetical protein